MADPRPVFFFDIDNCLYPKSKRVHDLMGDLIDKYFESHLSLSRAEANELHTRYYKDYGLAIEGLVRHHKVDPMEYNRQVDDALPLEDILEPNLQLRRLLEDLDTSKVKPWLFTNAYVTHGITFCDYAAMPFLCKPSPEMFKKAMKEAGIRDANKCYFVDDSALNAGGAQKLGWTALHLVEPEVTAPPKQVAQYQIQSLEELRSLFPQFWKEP